MVSTLKILNASNDCGIDQNCIQKLSLIKLDASYNGKITDKNYSKETLC